MPDKHFLLSEKYISYWDIWHRHWYRQAKKWLSNGYQPTKNDYISWLSPTRITTFGDNPFTLLDAMREQHNVKNGWRVPFRNSKPSIGRGETASWKFFPIPYWGDPDNSQLKAVFLNLNHQHPNEQLDIMHGTYEKIYDLYHQNIHSYHHTVKSLLKEPNSVTNRMYHIENLKVTALLTKHLKADVEVKNEDVLQCFLVPWLSASANEITNGYIQENAALIFNKVLKPISKISSGLASPLRGVVLMRWDNLDKIEFPQFQVCHFSEDEPKEKAILDAISSENKRWCISYFKIDSTIFLNFSFHGGNSYPTNIKGLVAAITYAKTKGKFQVKNL